MNIFKYLKMRKLIKKSQEEFEEALIDQQKFHLEMMLNKLNNNQMHNSGFILIGNEIFNPIKPTQQPIHDNDYDFKTTHHRKFHEWEMQRVNDYISKLETQF